MESISDESEFQKVLNNNKKLIIFCFHGWSGYSVVSKKIVEEWEQILGREIWIIDATELEYNNYFFEWLVNKEKGDWSKESIMTISRFSPRRRIHGYGEVCWIKNKEVIGFECIFNAFDPDKLETRTLELF